MKFSGLVSIFLCLVLAPLVAHALPKTAGGPGGVGLTDGTSDLVVWLRPDNNASEGQVVNPWSDSSGNTNNFSHFDADKRPLNRTNAINGQTAVEFDGVDDYLFAPNSSVSTDTSSETLFVVHDRANNAVDHCVVGDNTFNIYALYHKTDGWNWTISGGLDGAEANRDAGHGDTIDGLQMIVAVRTTDGGGSIALYDQAGLLKDPGSFIVPNANRQYIVGRNGSSEPQQFEGLMAEVVAFQANLNTAQRNLVENYLCSKYGMTLTGRDFYGGDTTGNGNYDWDVCGVGRLSLGTEVVNGGMSGFGIEATSGLGDGEWVLAGHNLEVGNRRVTTEVPAGMKRRWQRVWYLDKTGNVNVTLAFDHSDASLTQPVGGTDFALLYSATKSPYNFAALAIAESVSGDTVSFAVPDANLPDGYYTLASDEDIPAVSEMTGGTGPGGVGLTDGTSDLVLWLKPDSSASDGQPVNPWSDSSGNTNDCSHPAAGNRPVNRTNAINGQTAVEFDGLNDYLIAQNAESGDTSNETVFVVNDRDNNGTDDCVLGFQSSGAYSLNHRTGGWDWTISGSTQNGDSVRDAGHGSTITNLQMIVGVRSVSADSIALYDQGGFLKSDTFDSPLAPMQYLVGRRLNSGTAEFDGLMAEVVAFQTNLTTVQRYLVENYLCSKFDMTLTDRDFYAGDTAGNGDYDFDVFGIGRLSLGDQVTVAGQMGLGIAAPWGLSDNQWILAGHKVTNNAFVNFEGQGSTFRSWARVWYVDVTGIIDVRLSFGFSDAGLPQKGDDYELLYSAVNAFSWSTVDDADASVDGDRMHFDIPGASMVDGYYTVGYTVELGSLFMVR